MKLTSLHSTLCLIGKSFEQLGELQKKKNQHEFSII